MLATAICISCSIKKKICIDPSIVITNKQIATGEILKLSLKNNSKNNLTFLINENSKYYENYIFIKSTKLLSSIKIIVEDENGIETNLIIGGNSIHFKDYDQYKNEIISNKYCQTQIKKINFKEDILISIPFKIENIDKYTNYSYEYSLEKNKKYFVRIKYDIHEIAIDSLSKKGIIVYDKPIISNKVPIKFE
jgi:hypothetical protein